MSANDYRGLSKEELYLISRIEFEKQKLVTTGFVRDLFGSAKKAADILDSLTRKKRFIQLQRGKYLLVPIRAPNQQWMPNEFVVASLWMGETPYYIGYFTMYHYWHFTEQVPETLFVLNTKKSVRKIIGSVRFTALRIDQRKYFGVERTRIEDVDVCISDRERTLVDFIYRPTGSLVNVRTTLRNNMGRIDLDRFIAYLLRFPVVSVRKRAGFFLEELGCRARRLTQLMKSIGDDDTYVVLDPRTKTRQGKTNKDWKIIVNR